MNAMTEILTWAEAGPARAASQIDQHVGRRLRAARCAAGCSQEALGEVFGVTFQQVQKYENGKNRLSPTLLAAASQRFNLPVAYFFEGVPGFDPHAARDGAAPEGASDINQLIESLQNVGQPLRQALLKAGRLGKTHQAAIARVIEIAAGEG